MCQVSLVRLNLTMVFQPPAQAHDLVAIFAVGLAGILAVVAVIITLEVVVSASALCMKKYQERKKRLAVVDVPESPLPSRRPVTPLPRSRGSLQLSEEEAEPGSKHIAGSAPSFLTLLSKEIEEIVPLLAFSMLQRSRKVGAISPGSERRLLKGSRRW